MKRNKLETLDIKVYIIPLLIISGIFFVSGFMLLSSVRNHYYTQRTGEAVKLARSYAHSISKFTQAEDIVNRLLEDKIRIAASSVQYFEDELTNEMMISLASTLKVDEVDYYDASGILRVSNLESLVGWEIYPGHPIDLFLKSEDKILVEDIRKDVITGDLYKYGYLKLESGGLIQVGISAGSIAVLRDRFSVKALLDEMKVNADALHIDILDRDLSIIASSNIDNFEILKHREEAEAALIAGREYSYVSEFESDPHFDILVPLQMDDDNVFALSVGYSMEETAKAVRDVSLFGLGSLGLVYASIIFSMLATYRKNKRLLKAAYFDKLTDLPNKAYLESHINNDLADKDSGSGALLLLNILNFKQLNLTYGYNFGDAVLKALAERLKSQETQDLRLFRFTVDRFALYGSRFDATDDLIEAVEKVIKSFDEPLVVEGADLHLNTKTGIVLIDETYQDANRVFKDAAVAVEEIRDKDASYTLFNEPMFQSIQREDMLLKELRAAVENRDTDTLFLEYQPIISGKLNRIAGFEALGRMNSKIYGRVSPMEFIYIAEKNMLMAPLGSYFLDLALSFLKEMQTLDMAEIRIAVNISGLQLIQKDFTELVLAKLREHDVKSHQLELEITESILLDNFEMINAKLKKLRSLGIHIALDDFGTGYSSFVRLQELYIDTLKIDRHFVGKLEESHQDTITSDIIRMAHRYGLKVVAEGVETEMQRAYLLEHDCDYLQGYLYSPSVSGERAKKMLKEI